MKPAVKYVVKYLAPFCLILTLSTLAVAQASAGFPLVIVVHGIGGGNMDPGWSRQYANAWGVETHEVTFRYKGRTQISSYADFVPEAGDWALSVQNQIRDIVRQNPGRRIMIVSHSWGTVVTKMALDGGVGEGTSKQLVAQDNGIAAITPGDFEVEEWVTLGPALGREGTPELAGDLMKWRLNVPGGRPSIVKHWTNFYDVNDLVSIKSHNLRGADNVKLNSGKSSISAHTGIWTDPTVRKYIWNEALRISNMPRLTNTGKGPAAGTVRFIAWDNTTSQPLANAQVIVSGAINSPSEKFRESGTTNAAGTVDIPGIVLGVYTVTASHSSCPRFESGLTNLKPGEMHRLIMVCTQVIPPTGRRNTEPGPASSGSSEARILAEYRSLLPQSLQASKKPWHTRIDLIANATAVGNGSYRVAWKTYCLIEKGPDTGKDYLCFENDSALNMGQIAQAVGEMKSKLGIK